MTYYLVGVHVSLLLLHGKLPQMQQLRATHTFILSQFFWVMSLGMA